MCGNNVRSRLDFHDDTRVNHEVSSINPDLMSSKIDFEWYFPIYSQARPCQYDTEGVAIDSLEEPMPQLRMNSVECS